MINVAETISPCILWIDEIDKAFSNTESKGDSGTSNRVLATFISWLSEKTKPVFVIATANNIDLLPLEIIRKGRFDEIFFLDLPKKKNVKKFLKFIFKNLDQIVGNHLIIKISTIIRIIFRCRNSSKYY
jgi:SpoVK/Ycf46/Vps4 family AAA+-type ATPase